MTYPGVEGSLYSARARCFLKWFDLTPAEERGQRIRFGIAVLGAQRNCVAGVGLRKAAPCGDFVINSENPCPRRGCQPHREGRDFVLANYLLDELAIAPAIRRLERFEEVPSAWAGEAPADLSASRLPRKTARRAASSIRNASRSSLVSRSVITPSCRKAVSKATGSASSSPPFSRRMPREPPKTDCCLSDKGPTIRRLFAVRPVAQDTLPAGRILASCRAVG